MLNFVESSLSLRFRSCKINLGLLIFVCCYKPCCFVEFYPKFEPHQAAQCSKEDTVCLGVCYVGRIERNKKRKEGTGGKNALSLYKGSPHFVATCTPKPRPNTEFINPQGAQYKASIFKVIDLI